MPGIINWDELWKARHSNGFSHHGEDLVSHWDRRAKAFNKRVMGQRKRADLQVASLDLRPDETVLDIGAGTGRLAIPMARAARSVTALDQSGGMLQCLRENMQAEGITNIECVQKSWQDVGPGELPQHEVVLSSNSLGVYDIREALSKMNSLARRAVFIFTFTGSMRDDGLREFISPERRRRKAAWPPDYLVIYNLLADMGICADIKILGWESDEHYTSLDDAVSSWSEMYEVPEEKEPKLREFLSSKLVPCDGGLCLHRHSKMAMISWQKDQGSTA